jgi:pimeloyl-ACP methyl ester carboxylesterase
MNFAEHRIATADGPSVYARDYSAAGSRLPVICLHGLTRNSADFEGIAPRIASSGRRVIAIDARGRGKSDNDPDPARYRPDVYVGDVIRAMDILRIPRAVFLGTSMGGIMTMIAATVSSSRVSAAILNDIGPELDPAGIRRIASYVGKADLFASWPAFTAAVRSTQSVAFPKGDEAFWNAFARRVGRERADGWVEFAYDPAIASAFNTPPDSPPPSMIPLFEALAERPILVVRGAISDLLSPQGVATMKRVKPDLEYVEVPDVGHAPTLEEPQAWDAIASFLARAE